MGEEGRGRWGGSLGVSRLGTPPESTAGGTVRARPELGGKVSLDLKEKFQSLRSSRGGVLCWEDSTVANPPNVEVELYSVETSVKDDEGYKASFPEPRASASQMAPAAPDENSRTSEACSIIQESSQSRNPKKLRPEDSVDEDRISSKGRVHRDQEEKFVPCSLSPRPRSRFR